MLQRALLSAARGLVCLNPKNCQWITTSRRLEDFPTKSILFCNLVSKLSRGSLVSPLSLSTHTNTLSRVSALHAHTVSRVLFSSYFSPHIHTGARISFGLEFSDFPRLSCRYFDARTRNLLQSATLAKNGRMCWKGQQRGKGSGIRRETPMVVWGTAEVTGVNTPRTDSRADSPDSRCTGG